MTDAFWQRFLFPGALWLGLFFVVPFVIAVLISLGSDERVRRRHLRLEHRATTPTRSTRCSRRCWLRSVGYAAATAAICLLIGYPVAYCIARYGGKRRNLLIAAILAPFLINYLVRTYAWVALLADEGLVNSVLDSSIRFLNTPWAVIGGLVYGYLGFMILPIYASLERMDPALIEAGKDLYGTPRQTFWHVTWPQTLPGVLAGTRARVPAGGRRLRLGAAARRARHLHGREPDPAAVLRRRQLAVRRGADDRADGVPDAVHVLLPARGRQQEPARGAAMSVAAEQRVEVAGPVVARQRKPHRHDRPRVLWVVTGLVYLFLFAPILIVILFSFNSTRSLQTFEGFSLRWYEEFFNDESLRDVAVHVARDRGDHDRRRDGCWARGWRSA